MRIIKTAAVVGLSAIASMAFANVASAEKVKAESTVLIGAFDTSFGNFYVAGNVESTKKKCVAGRDIQLELSYSDKPSKIVDVDVTGKSGAYGFVAFGEDAENIEALEITVIKSKIQLKKNKTLICGKDFGFIV